MKLRLLLFTFLFSALSWGQGSETFTNLGTIAAYGNGSWTGDNGVTWNTTNARTDQTLTGKAVCTNGSGTVTSPTYSGGMGILTFNYVRGFTATSARSLTVWVNGIQIGGTTSVNATSNIVQNYSSLINVAGNVVLEIRTSGNQIIIDDIAWTAYSACTPPANPSGTITATLSCGATSLAYSVPSATSYWQTTATGTSTANPTTSPLVVATNGTYYVRDFVSSCWSTGNVSQAVTVVNAVNISTQPTNQATTVGNTATFSIAATNAASYQWQVSTNGGGTWTNVGTNTNTYTTPAATLAMSGNQYRVLITGNAPCANVTSSVGILTVTTGPCLSQSAFTSTPAGWVQTNVTYASSEAVFSANNGELATIAISNPASLTFDLRRTNNTNPKDLLIEISTTVQGGPYTTVSTYNLANTTIGTVSCSVDLSAYTSFPTVFIRFRKASATASPWYIQNVNVYCGIPIAGPEINVIGNMVTIPDNDTTPSLADNTNFGSALINTNIVKTFTIQNQGSTDLILSSPVILTDVSLPQEFVITQPLLTTIPAGNSTTFTVTFNSAVAGTFTNTLNINSNDVDEALYNFDIMATATIVTPTTGTVFNPGELVFVGYDGQIKGSNSEDEYLIATLVDMIPGTSFSLVNSRYEAGAAANVRTNKWGGGGDNASLQPYEVKLTYNGATVIPAGSVLRFETTDSFFTWISVVDVITGTTSTTRTSEFSGNLISGNPNISTNGSDQMFLMQGSFTSDGSIDVGEANYILNGTLLHGITNRANWVPLTSACNGGSTGGNTRESRLPSELTCFNVENASTNSISGYYENDKQHGLATIRDIILGISDVTNNWTLSTGRYTIDAASNAANRAGRTFLIGPSNAAGQWVGNVDTNWFNCANWEGLAVPVAATNVTVSNNSLQEAAIVYNAPFANEYANVAVCNDITISDYKVVLEGSASNVLYVNGNLSISNIGVLDMDDANALTADGTIHLRGNWENLVHETAFQEGNGTVYFDGVSPQIINDVIPINTELFYNVVLNNSFDTAISNNLIAQGNATVAAGYNLNIAADDYVRVNNKLTLNGTLTIQNNGQLIQVNETDTNDGLYTGTQFQLNRTANVRNLDYVYWSAPVENFNILNVPNSHRYFWNTLNMNGNGTQGNWIPASGIMTKGKGYIVRASNGATVNQDLNVVFNGKPNNGAFTLPIERGTYDGADYDAEPGNPNNVFTTKYDDNWNLVGNPYPSAIDAESFLVANQTKIEGSVWIWTHGLLPTSNIDPFYQSFVFNYSANDYIKYNGLGATEPDTFAGIIASGQGFMVNMLHTTPSPNTLNFENSFRTTLTGNPYNNNNFFRNATQNVSFENQEKHRIWLSIIDTATGESDKTLVGYAANATDQKDHFYDCLHKPSSSISLYSLIGDEPFIIQGKGLPFQTSDTIPMGLRANTTNNLMIAIHKVDGLFAAGQTVYLEDKLLGTIHNLTIAPYNFSAQKGNHPDRFVLRFTDRVLTTQTVENQNDVLIYAADALHFSSKGENLQKIQVYSILGQILYEQDNVNEKNAVVSVLQKNSVPLIVRVTLADGAIINKKVIY